MFHRGGKLMNHTQMTAILAGSLATLFLGLAPAYGQVPTGITPAPAGDPAPPNPTETTTEPITNFGTDNPTLQRARNLARQAAERANGGLEKYRAEASMYGPATQSPVVDNGNGTWTFTFRGGPPDSQTPTLESAVTVAKDGSKLNLDYNGPMRNAASPAPATAPGSTQMDNDIALRRAMNLARQAAERANGGLDKYRAEPSMYGMTERAPVVYNNNDSWTFTFQGGAPEAAPTVESVVTVTRDRRVTVDYNGPIRQTSGGAPAGQAPQPQPLQPAFPNPPVPAAPGS
jgi:hypothetical protein